MIRLVSRGDATGLVISMNDRTYLLVYRMNLSVMCGPLCPPWLKRIFARYTFVYFTPCPQKLYPAHRHARLSFPAWPTSASSFFGTSISLSTKTWSLENTDCLGFACMRLRFIMGWLSF